MEKIHEKAILVGVHFKNQKDDHFDYSMEELKELAHACDVEVVGTVSQKLDRVNSAHYIGKGKIDEVAAMLEHFEGNLVIFNDELSPAQIKNLEAQLECKVIDRTLLILDIFAERAKSREAILQVEVAKLKYMLPRLIGLRESLGRQGGGAGLNNKGSGETKLELDRRRIEKDIAALNKELDTLVLGRQVQRKQRKKNEIPVVSLVGYTNAGKSTIMNALVGLYEDSSHKEVFEKDMLFATLDTSVRNIKLQHNKEFLLTDTVGFVDKLPHHLVKAFRSTLEEAAEADLLLHVVDYSNPNYEKMIDVTNKTLEQMGVKDIPTIYVYNKADLTDLEIPMVKEDSVYLSAKNRVGINELIEIISKNIFTDYITCKLLIPFDKGHIVSYFNEHAQIHETTYESEGTILSLTCKNADYEHYKQYVFVEKSE